MQRTGERNAAMQDLTPCRQAVTLKRPTSELSCSAVAASDCAEAAISWVEALVSWVEAETCSAEAEDCSATAATSEIPSSAREDSEEIWATAVAISPTRDRK